GTGMPLTGSAAGTRGVPFAGLDDGTGMLFTGSAAGGVLFAGLGGSGTARGGSGAGSGRSAQSSSATGRITSSSAAGSTTRAFDMLGQAGPGGDDAGQVGIGGQAVRTRRACLADGWLVGRRLKDAGHPSHKTPVWKTCAGWAGARDSRESETESGPALGFA